tara:strand:+ start:558 stop:746 length:189 start_codon:yes stop_codon:yes gene_type:complete
MDTTESIPRCSCNKADNTSVLFLSSFLVNMGGTGLLLLVFLNKIEKQLKNSIYSTLSDSEEP